MAVDNGDAPFSGFSKAFVHSLAVLYRIVENRADKKSNALI
jgi:hypothetical protein